MQVIDDDTLKQFTIVPETASLSSIKAMAEELQSRRAKEAAIAAEEEGK